jgi:hypothetical protein
VGEGIYRDELLGLRARLAELESRAREREERLTADLFHFLPHAVQERIAAHKAERGAPGDTLDELSVAEGSATQYLALLDEVLARAPELEQQLRALPAKAPTIARDPRGTPWWLTFGAEMSESLTTVGAVLGRVVARHDPSARVEALDDFGFEARLVAMQSPIALLVECFVDRDRLLEPRVRIATSVPRGTPRVRVMPESWGQSLLRSLGLSHAMQTNDADFDGRFVVEGDAAQAARILSPPVRASLAAIARDDVPELLVEDGRAMLTWSFEPTERALDAAFFVLGRARAADIALQLTR